MQLLPHDMQELPRIGRAWLLAAFLLLADSVFM
jgi:hypothetical protein